MAALALEPLTRDTLAGPVAPDGERVDADLCVLTAFAEERPLLGLAGFVDWRSSGRLTAVLRSGLFSARRDERVLLPGRPGLPLGRWVLYGLGEAETFDADAAAAAASHVADLARGLHVHDVVVAVPGVLASREAGEAFVAELDRVLEDQGNRGEGHARWWAVVDPRAVPRLRRALVGPPRATPVG